ncbi:DoxX family protein [Actinomycetospora soli]|uniref:DoxX family protein n=1 Tax=Actinomycetospora soli TaxID=2893887 RepID=UPI001E36F54E|nr:DoxX family protein [Actinomycetospora soli]MCD2186416.1 DoxX family protein [Actinomycetospora soli]
MLVRRLARPMLAAVFIKGGIDTLLNPEPRIGMAAPKIQQAENAVGDKLPPQAPTEPDQLVRIDAGVKIGAGVLLALGKFPRIASLALAASVIPTTVVGHAFWEVDNPADRSAQEIHFLKNLGLLGGLILAAVDTEGKPSLGWRARRASRKLAKQTRELTGSAQEHDFAGQAKSAAGTAGATARDAVDVAIGRFVA